MNARIKTWDQPHNLDALEQRLRGALRPVVPSQDMVQRLRGQIHFPDPGELAERLRGWQTLLVVLGGVLSGALLILTLARALFHLTGRRGPA